MVINNESIGLPIHNETKKILKSINEKLFSSIESSTRAEINKLPTFRYRELKHVTLNGPLETKIMTQPDGIITATVKGFTISTEIKIDISGLTLYAKIKTSELNLSADYNPINGQIYNIRDNGNLRVHVDIDGNGTFNKLVTKVTKSLLKIFKPNFFQQKLNSILSSIHNHKYYVAGIESVIPDNTWIINGMDLGFEIKNTIKGIHPEKYISIAISEKNHRYYTGWNYREYYMNKVDFDISGNYKISYENQAVYDTGRWINPCASHGCYEP